MGKKRVLNVLLIFVFYLTVMPLTIIHASESREPPPSEAKAWKWLGPPGGNIKCLAFNPKNRKQLYALTYSKYDAPSFVYFSKNSGGKWTKQSRIPDNSRCSFLAVSPSKPSILYVQGQSSLFRSTDSGKNWTTNSLPNYFYGYSQFCVHPKKPDTVYSVGEYIYDQKNWNYGAAVAISKNGGKDWTIIQLNNENGYSFDYSIAQSSKNPKILYAGITYWKSGKTHYKIYRSSNDGKTWLDRSNGITGTPYSLQIDPKNPNKVHAGTSWGAYNTSNGGVSWTASDLSSSVYSLGMDAKNPNILYAGYDGKCYKSTNGGVNFIEYTQGLYGECNTVLADGQNVFYASTAGPFRSINGGKNYKKIYSGMKYFNQVNSVAVCQSSPNMIYADASLNGLFLSKNRGGKWNRLPPFDACDGVTKILVNPTNPSELFIMASG